MIFLRSFECLLPRVATRSRSQVGVQHPPPAQRGLIKTRHNASIRRFFVVFIIQLSVLFSFPLNLAIWSFVWATICRRRGTFCTWLTSGNPVFVRHSVNIFSRYPLLSFALRQAISGTRATGSIMADMNSLNGTIIFFLRSVVTIKR